MLRGSESETQGVLWKSTVAVFLHVMCVTANDGMGYPMCQGVPRRHAYGTGREQRRHCPQQIVFRWRPQKVRPVNVTHIDTRIPLHAAKVMAVSKLRIPLRLALRLTNVGVVPWPCILFPMMSAMSMYSVTIEKVPQRRVFPRLWARQ